MTTKTAQFTLGPWKVVHDNAIDATYIVPVKPCDSHALARVYRNHPEYEDNAAFIAAAPVLYEALSELVKYLREEVADEALDTWAPVFKAAMALAQAEGK